MKKKSLLEKITYWAYYLLSAGILIAIAFHRNSFENVEQWLIAFLIALFLFRWEGSHD